MSEESSNSGASSVPFRGAFAGTEAGKALLQKALDKGCPRHMLQEDLDEFETRGEDPSHRIEGRAEMLYTQDGQPYFDTSGPLELDPFEVDILERMIAGKLLTETIVGDGEFAKFAFGSLRDRVEPQSELAEIDARVADRAATAFITPKPGQEGLD